MASAFLTIVVIISAWSLISEMDRIRHLATDTRTSLLPELLEHQRDTMALKRIQQYGTLILESADSKARAESMVEIARLVSQLQHDPAIFGLAQRAETRVGALERAREQGDLLRAQGHGPEADAAESQARQDWRNIYQSLDGLSEALLKDASDRGGRRTDEFDFLGRQVQTLVAIVYGMLCLALLAVGLLVHQWLIKPILLTTVALDRTESSPAVALPVAQIREIDLFYRSVERIAASLTEIEEAHRQARGAQAELRRLASIDELTGVANRRWFTAMANRELERCRRFNHPLGLLMIDVDHFKRVNDTHGHAVGDEVLRAFTRVLEGNLRSVDLLGRLGGEEFAVILPEAEEKAALQTGERLRAAVEALQFPFEDGTLLQITTSVGIAILANGGESLDSLLARADAALYEAKRGGRNRVVYGQIK